MNAALERIKVPYGLEDFSMEATGDENYAVIETEGGQWSVAMVDSLPDHADFKQPSPWSSLSMAEYLAELHNRNIAAMPSAPATSDAEALRAALSKVIGIAERVVHAHDPENARYILKVKHERAATMYELENILEAAREAIAKQKQGG